MGPIGRLYGGALTRWCQGVYRSDKAKTAQPPRFVYGERCERLGYGSTSSLALCEQRRAQSAEDGVQKRVVAGGGDHRWVAV